MNLKKITSSNIFEHIEQLWLRLNKVEAAGGSGNTPTLQEVTDEGNTTTNVIETPEVKDISDTDSIMTLSKSSLTFGNVGNTYGGNYTKYASMYDPSYAYSAEANSGDTIDFYNSIDADNEYELFIDKGSFFGYINYHDGSTEGYQTNFGLQDGFYISSKKLDASKVITSQKSITLGGSNSDVSFANNNGSLTFNMPTDNNAILGLTNTMVVLGDVAPTPTSVGTVGEMRMVNDGYLYVCVATNTWQRTPLTTW